MAAYKVPQDVEAEDKLIGPFSFRQFIYLIVAALAIFLGYGLSRIFWALALIPSPIAIFFLVMALPLKKDQPMEVYLTAIIRFLLKPRVRLWDPEGEFSLVEITAAREDTGPALKDFSGTEASEKLRYLSRVVDTGGWATRGLNSPLDNLNFNDTLVAEAQSAEDVLDATGNVSQNINTKIVESDQARKQEMIQTMKATIAQTTASAAATPLQQAPQAQAQTIPTAPEEPQSIPMPAVAYNPYPSAIHQKIIAPVDDTTPVVAAQNATPVQAQPPSPTKQAQAPSEDVVSPDIMRLATSKDLSISTIAREAERLQKKNLDENEVVVSLR